MKLRVAGESAEHNVEPTGEAGGGQVEPTTAAAVPSIEARTALSDHCRATVANNDKIAAILLVTNCNRARILPVSIDRSFVDQ